MPRANWGQLEESAKADMVIQKDLPHGGEIHHRALAWGKHGAGQSITEKEHALQ